MFVEQRKLFRTEVTLLSGEVIQYDYNVRDTNHAIAWAKHDNSKHFKNGVVTRLVAYPIDE